jgi:hypothetical protein
LRTIVRARKPQALPHEVLLVAHFAEGHMHAPGTRDQGTDK